MIEAERLEYVHGKDCLSILRVGIDQGEEVDRVGYYMKYSQISQI
jgi:hypothetical protein